MGMTTIWIILAIVFLAVELVTVGMVSIWFFAGSLVSLVVSLLGGPFWLQLVLFLLVSGGCFALLYPRLKHLVRKNHQATNADMVLGQICVVKERIDNIAGTGSVTVAGKTWSARTAGGETAEPGSLVRAENIQGVKLIVTPVGDQ